MRDKYIAQRACKGCGEKRPKSEMIRLGYDGTFKITIWNGKKDKGRGAYICPDTSCLKKARKKDRLSKGLRVSVPDEMYDQIEVIIKKRGEKYNGEKN